MEQPCYKCGQPLEQGRPFCPHCGAPQIRVVVAELEPDPTSPAFPDASVSAPPFAGDRAVPTLPVLALPMAWSEAVKPCALAALVACILMSLGLHPFVAMPSAGFLAVVFYRQRRMGLPISLLAGIRLGALSGLLFFALSSIVGAAVALSGHKGDEIRKGMVDVITQAASKTSDPQLITLFDRFKTPEGLEFLMVFLIVFTLVSSIVLGALGGALGGTIFGRRNKR